MGKLRITEKTHMKNGEGSDVYTDYHDARKRNIVVNLYDYYNAGVDNIVASFQYFVNAKKDIKQLEQQYKEAVADTKRQAEFKKNELERQAYEIEQKCMSTPEVMEYLSDKRKLEQERDDIKQETEGLKQEASQILDGNNIRDEYRSKITIEKTAEVDACRKKGILLEESSQNTGINSGLKAEYMLMEEPDEVKKYKEEREKRKKEKDYILQEKNYWENYKTNVVFYEMPKSSFSDQNEGSEHDDARKTEFSEAITYVERKDAWIERQLELYVDPIDAIMLPFKQLREVARALFCIPVYLIKLIQKFFDRHEDITGVETLKDKSGYLYDIISVLLNIIFLLGAIRPGTSSLFILALFGGITVFAGEIYLRSRIKTENTADKSGVKIPLIMGCIVILLLIISYVPYGALFGFFWEKGKAVFILWLVICLALYFLNIITDLITRRRRVANKKMYEENRQSQWSSKNDRMRGLLLTYRNKYKELSDKYAVLSVNDIEKEIELLSKEIDSLYTKCKRDLENARSKTEDAVTKAINEILDREKNKAFDMLNSVSANENKIASINSVIDEINTMIKACNKEEFEKAERIRSQEADVNKECEEKLREYEEMLNGEVSKIKTEYDEKWKEHITKLHSNGLKEKTKGSEKWWEYTEGFDYRYAWIAMYGFARNADGEPSGADGIREYIGETYRKMMTDAYHLNDSVDDINIMPSKFITGIELVDLGDQTVQEDLIKEIFNDEVLCNRENKLQWTYEDNDQQKITPKKLPIVPFRGFYKIRLSSNEIEDKDYHPYVFLYDFGDIYADKTEIINDLNYYIIRSFVVPLLHSYRYDEERFKVSVLTSQETSDKFKRNPVWNDIGSKDGKFGAKIYNPNEFQSVIDEVEKDGDKTYSRLQGKSILEKKILSSWSGEDDLDVYHILIFAFLDYSAFKSGNAEDKLGKIIKRNCEEYGVYPIFMINAHDLYKDGRPNNAAIEVCGKIITNLEDAQYFMLEDTFKRPKGKWENQREWGVDSDGKEVERDFHHNKKADFFFKDHMMRFNAIMKTQEEVLEVIRG